jgi:hypothetical protein
MNRNFNIVEILESVDSIVSDNRHTKYNKKRIIDRYRKFTDKKIDMKFFKDTEKIILAAEKSLKDNKANKPDNKIILENVVKEDSQGSNYEKPLILNNEYIENKSESLLEEKNVILESENLKQKEAIKDLNILLDSFREKKRYSELDEKIKLYQDDNALLRKKIFEISDKEASLRLQLSDKDQNESIDKKNKVLATKSPAENENIQNLNKAILSLNSVISTLIEKNHNLENEVLLLKQNKTSYDQNIDQKIQFYREENAKIIIDKSNIQRKLENTKHQLELNEKNKKELRVALDNLNQILATSNVESSTFINKTEEQTTNISPIVDRDKKED